MTILPSSSLAFFMTGGTLPLSTACGLGRTADQQRLCILLADSESTGGSQRNLCAGEAGKPAGEGSL